MHLWTTARFHLGLRGDVHIQLRQDIFDVQKLDEFTIIFQHAIEDVARESGKDFRNRTNQAVTKLTDLVNVFHHNSQVQALELANNNALTFQEILILILLSCSQEVTNV